MDAVDLPCFDTAHEWDDTDAEGVAVPGTYCLACGRLARDQAIVTGLQVLAEDRRKAIEEAKGYLAGISALREYRPELHAARRALRRAP